MSLYIRKKERDGQSYFWFDVVSDGNNEIVTQSETYTSKQARDDSVELFTAYGIPVRES